MTLYFSILDHHLIEFISLSELAMLLEEIGFSDASITTGPSYVLYCQGDYLFFFTAKNGSCNGEWSDMNCSEHIVIYATLPGCKPNRFELALSHMSLTTSELKQLIQNYIHVMVTQYAAEREIQHNGCHENSHNARPTLENIQAAFQYQYNA